MEKTSVTPKYDTKPYSEKCFLSGVSKQLHKAEHTKTCFKKKHQHEKVDSTYLTRSAELQNCYLIIKIQSGIIGMD